ncbi:hypothetical protein QBC37DRAFT_429775 [Rhypophila decipiens]|uniref:Uncharacterized protein n=1 Tax=Rhypophila decipiens TaxID=261697 RepID=A0AAN7B203_9PEZI|nr:hypothetical protein QBC37DRAFT_429775 [Rhypophila decipiens]
MPSAAAMTISLFGASSALIGTNNLLSPTSALASLDLPSTAIAASNGLSLAAIAMGIYYSLAAYQDNRPFFVLTVPMRLLTATVFWAQGDAWRLPAVWEGGGALFTLGALIWDRSSRASMRAR